MHLDSPAVKIRFYPHYTHYTRAFYLDIFIIKKKKENGRSSLAPVHLINISFVGTKMAPIPQNIYITIN